MASKRSRRSRSSRRVRARRSRHGNAPPAATRIWLREGTVPYRGMTLVVYRHAKKSGLFEVHVQDTVFGGDTTQVTVSGKSEPAVLDHAKRVVDAIKA